MRFEWAMSFMRLGRWVRRPTKYACYDRWYTFKDGVIVNSNIEPPTEKRVVSWCSHISADALSASDWEVVEEEGEG